MEEEQKKEEINQKTNKNIFVSIIIAIIVMVYFIVLNIGYDHIAESIFAKLLQGSAMVLLAAAIIVFEIAYKKDSGKIAIIGIESLVIACHTLSIPYVTKVFDFDFKLYVVVSSYIFACYFVLKAIVWYTKGRKEYLDSLSDIAEIVKEEPVKKEATKKSKEAEDE